MSLDFFSIMSSFFNYVASGIERKGKDNLGKAKGKLTAFECKILKQQLQLF